MEMALLSHILLLLIFIHRGSCVLLEVVSSHDKPIRVGSPVSVFCTVVNASSSTEIQWYKKKHLSDREAVIAEGNSIKAPFLLTRRYKLESVDLDYFPTVLKIFKGKHSLLFMIEGKTDVQKADAGYIGCRYEDSSADVHIDVLGRVDEVIIDVRKTGRREVSYSKPGDRVHFLYPQSDLGSTIKCHVQATTKKVNIKIRLDGREIPGRMSPAIADPITSNPLQERVFTFHKTISNFIPNGSLNGKSLECAASSPNYPNVVSTNYITLDVEHVPRGMCYSSVATDSSPPAILIRCDLSYNPTFISASWHVKSTGKRYNGYASNSSFITTYHKIYSLYEASFYLRWSLADDSMAENEMVELEVTNWPGRELFPVQFQKPLIIPTTPEPTTTSSTTTITSTTETTTETTVSTIAPTSTVVAEPVQTATATAKAATTLSLMTTGSSGDDDEKIIFQDSTLTLESEVSDAAKTTKDSSPTKAPALPVAATITGSGRNAAPEKKCLSHTASIITLCVIWASSVY